MIVAPLRRQLVELKTGETYNGYLGGCDNWMNLHLKEAICTARDGDRFWKLAEVLVRGNNIKYIRIPEEVILTVPDEEPAVRSRATTSPDAALQYLPMLAPPCALPRVPRQPSDACSPHPPPH